MLFVLDSIIVVLFLFPFCFVYSIVEVPSCDTYWRLGQKPLDRKMPVGPFPRILSLEYQLLLRCLCLQFYNRRPVQLRAIILVQPSHLYI